MVLPCSATTRRASSSWWVRISSAIAFNTAPRSGPLLRLHSRWARRAASSACSACPSSALTQEPPMYIAGSRPKTLTTSIIHPFSRRACVQVGLQRGHHEREQMRNLVLSVRGQDANLADHVGRRLEEEHPDEQLEQRTGPLR